MSSPLPNPLFSYFALGFGVIGFVALKVWGRILNRKHHHSKR